MFEKYLIPAEEGFFSNLKAKKEAKRIEKKQAQAALDWFDETYGNSIRNIAQKYANILFNPIAQIVKDAEKSLGLPVGQVDVIKSKVEWDTLTISLIDVITPERDYDGKYEKFENVFNPRIRSYDFSKYEKQIQNDLKKVIPFEFTAKLKDYQPDICYNISLMIDLDIMADYKQSQVAQEAYQLNYSAADKEIVEKVLNDLYNETKTQSIRLVCSKKSTFDPRRITDTQIGGIPYWPSDKPFPMWKDEIPMIMVAQLNFEKLPKIPNYPTKGILQFFVSPDDSTGTWGDGKHLVVYHPTITTSGNISVPKISTMNINKVIPRAYFPIDGVYYPEIRVETVGLNPTCNDFYEKFIKYLNKCVKPDRPYEFYRDIPKNYIDAMYDLFSFSTVNGCRLGGYACFVQNDDRDMKNNEQLLLQLDSEGAMMWGDNGSAQFLITPKDLKAKNFNNVHFTWSCY